MKFGEIVVSTQPRMILTVTVVKEDLHNPRVPINLRE